MSLVAQPLNPERTARELPLIGEQDSDGAWRHYLQTV